MRGDNNYNQYPYQNFYVNVPCYYVCPAMQNSYGYYQPQYNNFYRTEEEGYQEGYQNYFDKPNDERNKLKKEHIDKVIEMTKKDSMHFLKDIQKFITHSKLLDYLLMTLITYICSNIHKYQDNTKEKRDELLEDIRVHLPWVADIMNLFGITPEVVDKFLENVIRFTLMNIKKLVF